jgi:hypothetical protein
MNAQQAEAFAKDWIAAWKRRDAEAVLSHYSDDVEFQSPLVVMLLGDPSGTVRGKQHLREYFQKVLTAFPEPPNTELLGVYQGVESLLVHFQVGGSKGIEVMELNQKERIRRAITLGSTLNPPLPPNSSE